MIRAFNSWWLKLDDTLQVAFLGVGATILTAILAGVVALIVVWAQNRMARRAIEVQERTVYLTLIERRAEWLDGAVSTWGLWINEQETRIEAIIQNREISDSPSLREISNSRRQARWLFGPEIDAHLEELELAVLNYSEKRLAVREIGIMTPSERPQMDTRKRREEFTQSLARVMDLQWRLSNLTRPYLFVGDIRAKTLVPLSKSNPN